MIPKRQPAVLGLFILTLFTGSALLFLVQPMFAKMVLPLLGGTPAVWATAMVFFQATLLAGYAYAHWSVAKLGVRRQAIWHAPLVLLPLLLLPISVPAGWAPPTDGKPVLWLLGLLAVALGLPFFVLSSSAPLLQRWFASTGHPSGKDPYFLYAASNTGSMLALLSYPFLMEPALPLDVQAMVWAAGYGALALGTLACAWVAAGRRGPHAAAAAPGEPPAAGAGAVGPGGETAAGAATATPSGETAAEAGPAPDTPARPEATAVVPATRRLRWVALAFLPSVLMIAVTTYLSTDIAAIPLLWVLPLAIYLLTFILVFSSGRAFPMVGPTRLLAVVLILSVLVLLKDDDSLPRWIVLAAPLLGLFMVSLVCHARLANDRPPPSHLTEFYLWMSVGGVLGGSFAALLAPVAFNNLLEYPLAIVLACFLMPRLSEKAADPKRERLILGAIPTVFMLATVGLILGIQNWLPFAGRMVALTVVLGFCTLLVTRPLRFGLGVASVIIGATIATGQVAVLYSDRTFFGVQQVIVDGGRFHRLMHGTTLHGIQNREPGQRLEPLSYYHRESPVGQVMTELAVAGAPRIGAVGLGTGSLACYARPDQEWTFFEIDPAMEQIARDPELFTFLSDCPGEHEVVLGDARLSLQEVAGSHYGVLVVDAFNSDSIPVHLITREAMQLYLDKLAPGGVITIHISNRYLDLRPVLGNLAEELGLWAIHGSHPVSVEQKAAGKSHSDWVVLSRNLADLGTLAGDPRWTALDGEPGARVWTDDFSDIFSVFRWRTG